MESEWEAFSSLFAEPQKNGLTRPKAARGYGLPMVNMGELFAFSRILPMKMDRVLVSEKERSFVLENGDLLYARQSLVFEGAGKCSIFLGDGEPTVFESHIIRCRLNRRKADPLFYFYFFQSPPGRDAISSIVEQGAGAAGIRASDLAKLFVPVPPLPLQLAASSVLNALDIKIEILRQANELLEGIAKAIFKSWFVDYDPVRAKAEGREPEGMDAVTAALFPSSFEDSRGGMVPSGWRVVSIREVATLNRGLSYKGAFLAESGTPMINLGCFLGGGGFDLSKLKFYSGDFKPRHVVRSGDLVIANTDITQKRNVIGSPAIVPPSDGDGYLFTHHTFVLRPSIGLNGLARYLYYTLLQPSFRERAIGFATGTTVLALPQDAVLAHDVVLPETSVLSAFTNLIAAMTESINNNSRQSSVLSSLRDTLLPRLISGKLRLPEAEKLVEAVV